MRCCSSCSSTTIRPMFGSFIGFCAGFMQRAPHSARGNAGCRGDPDPMVDTVTHDPHGLRRRQPPAPTTAAVAGDPASASASFSSFEPLRPSGRNRSPGPAARTTTDAGTTSASQTARSRPSGHAAGGPCLDPASISTPANGPGPVARGRPAPRMSRRPHRTRTSRPPTRSIRSPPGSWPRRAVAARDREDAFDGGRRRRCRGAEPTPHHPAAERAAATPRPRRHRRARCAAASASSSSSSSRSSSAWRASTSTRSRSAPLRAAG